MPTLEIKQDKSRDTVIRMGHAPEVIEPPKATAAAVPIPDNKPSELTTKNTGRKQMADDKKLDHESGGPETIREDKAGEKGAIGSGGVNAPAQEKTPKGEGNKEGE